MTFKIAAVLLPLILFTTCQSFAQYKVKRYSAIVRTVDGKRLKGLFELVGDSGVTIRYHKKSRIIAADTIERIRIKRYNAQNRSFLQGGLLGLAGGLTVYKLESDKGNIGPIILPVVVVSSIVSGAAFFATVNSLTSKARFKDVNQPGKFESIRSRLKKYSLNR